MPLALMSSSTVPCRMQERSSNRLWRDSVATCPGPGEFQCASTGLVFVMAQEAELLYRTVPWEESLLQSAGKQQQGRCSR
ncbi:hypothetical protein F7725_017731 [Dissostichus mawsoni]|uniref:FIIND domain-containing protein n=1 Tax=Dissostichus mawsoni TaxID=36200 RepID=A0A7J5XPJ4_DISMA|nr:hypothetical protein F7725_017731 [Dissostichus mawsoni]